MRHASIDPIDHKKRQRSSSGQKQLVPPSKIKHVIREPQEAHARNRQEGRDELGQLMMRKFLWGGVVASESKWDVKEHHYQENHAADDSHCLRDLRSLIWPDQHAILVTCGRHLVEVDAKEASFDKLLPEVRDNVQRA
eukprot:CAMPEP_0185253374 /NCGR_PEP_ID=MMETSP1359-20130426/2154_1 /TAXON_ID=552665 /ORGANISM="Bigelowiella longifila, Strain CCMP242" /LENGTH=137 /DNA_ID=CAMNT_0027835743 /DNA_START=923 /DNA_END=1336 /DNA_ORIENTATION=+